MAEHTLENIRRLRELMTELQLDAYIVPTADPHQTEYVHPHWKCREWISGFSGSAGTVAVLRDKAGLWTDGRYFIQADQELTGSGIDLFKMRMPEVPEMIDWVCKNVPSGGSVAVNGLQISAKQAAEWAEKLDRKGIGLTTDTDLISRLWKARPSLPKAPAYLHPTEFAGPSAAEKLAGIREAMREKGADTYLVTSLYDIAWLFNIRGNDIPYCPVVMAYALVTAESARLFIDETKPTDPVRREFDLC